MGKSERRSLLLFSGGQSEPNQSYYHYADSWLPVYLAEKLGSHSRVMFAPWAVWGGHSADDMFRYGSEHWGRLGISLEPLHRQGDMVRAVEEADAVIVGGGSVHMLVKSLAEHKLMPAIQRHVRDGGLYIGTSAGSVVACPTRLSAMEPPPIALERYRTMNLVPFQITPHYYEPRKDVHHSGPPPIARIRNYIAFNHDPKPVVGLKDGSCLKVENRTMTLLGEKTAMIVSPETGEDRVRPNADLSDLLDTHSAYYRANRRRQRAESTE